MDGRMLQTAWGPHADGKMAPSLSPAVALDTAMHAGWERLFDQSAVGVMQTGPDLRVTRVNRRVADMLGYSMEELVGKTVHDLTYPDDRERSAQVVRDFSREHPICQWEKRYLHKNG